MTTPVIHYGVNMGKNDVEQGEETPLLIQSVDNDKGQKAKDNIPNAEENVCANKVKVTRLVTIEPVVVLYFMVTVAFVPLLQQYLYARLSKEYGYVDPNSASSDDELCGVPDQNTTDKSYHKVQTDASIWFVMLAGSIVGPSMVLTMFIGPYSDKAGRKIAIIPPLLGGTVRTAVNLIVMAKELPLWIMLIGAVFDGLTGGPGALLAGSFSYTADVSTYENRFLRIFIIDLSMGLGTTVAQVAIGFLISALGFIYPVLIILSIYLVIFVYAFFLPETIIKDPKAKLFECHYLFQTTSLYVKKTANNRSWKLIMIVVIILISTTLELGSGEIITFYFLNPPFCWTSVYIGIYAGYAFVMKSFFSICCIKVLKRRVSEMIIAITGVCSSMTYFLVLSGVTTTRGAFIGMYI